ncbi:MAG: hypothetical protein KAX31_07580, partial [Thermoplasmata archaeon]|nr:hypothetical protein [Thermoplasmata archaeon]
AMGTGLSIVVLSLMLSFFIPEMICLLYPWGSLIGFLIFLWGLLRIRDEGDLGRRVVYVIGTGFIVFSVLSLGLILELYELDKVGYACLLCAPPLVVLALPRPIPRQARFGLSVIVGVFLLMFGFTLALGLDLGGWNGYYSLLFVCFGLAAMLLAWDLGSGLKMGIWPVVFFSSGLFIISIVAILLYVSESTLSPMAMGSAGAWLVLGGYLCTALLERNNWQARVVEGMKHGAAFSLGLGFGAFGVILIMVHQPLAGAVELGIGLPLLWYGGKDAVRHILPSRLFTIGILSLVEITTIITLIWG